MLGNLAKSRGLRVFALLLLFGTPKGRQIYGRAKAVEAERGIKTKAWDDVIDYNREIHHEHDNEEHDEGSSDIAKAKGTFHPCEVLNRVIVTLPDVCERKKICESTWKCFCKYKVIGLNNTKCVGCSKPNEGLARF